MEWRCTRCGKPHAENDPPCDECGHNAFEKAIVRVDERDGEPSDTVETGPEYVWACTNCGREHVRNTPPCSRCGNPDLEKAERTYEGLERDLTAPGWLEVAKPYLPVAVLIALVVALFATGIVPPTVLPGIGAPSPPDAPGEGAEYAGLDLEAVDTDVHDRLEAEREAGERRTYDDGLAAYAEYYNRMLVAVEFDDTEPDAPDPGAFDHGCSDAQIVTAQLTLGDAAVDEYDDERAFGDAVAEVLLTEYGEEMRSGFDSEGVDIHVAPNGDVYVFYAAC